MSANNKVRVCDSIIPLKKMIKNWIIRIKHITNWTFFVEILASPLHNGYYEKFGSQEA